MDQGEQCSVHVPCIVEPVIQKESFSVIKKRCHLFALIFAYRIRPLFIVPIISPDIGIIPVTSVFDGPDPFLYTVLKRFNVIKDLFDRISVRHHSRSAPGEV